MHEYYITIENGVEWVGIPDTTLGELMDECESKSLDYVWGFCDEHVEHEEIEYGI